MKEILYIQDPKGRRAWCATHHRPATYLRIRIFEDGRREESLQCDPKLGGITFPCSVREGAGP